MKIWTPEEEAEKLKARFAGVNRAAFAREHQVKGGQAVVYQHINGIRPINLDAAKAYAAGFRVSLEEISPRLAKEVAEATVLTQDRSIFDQAVADAKPKDWPFSASREAFDALKPADREALDRVVSQFISASSASGAMELGRAASDAAIEHTTRMRPKHAK